MDDTRLLEDAARAIGRKITAWNSQHWVAVAILDDGSFWQPLLENHITDCMGDALRLAVKLFLWEAVRDGYQHVDSDNDFCAATRRAIVRAAAALAPTNRPVSPDTSA